MNTLSQQLGQHHQDHPDRVCIYLQHAGQPDLPITYRDLIHGSASYAQLLEQNGIFY